MVDPRIHKRVAERLDLRLSRHANGYRRWRLWSGLLAALVTAAIVLIAWLAWGERIFQARPVAAAHQGFRNDCQQCHVVPAQTIRMDLFDDREVYALERQACLSCHPQIGHDDHHDFDKQHRQTCFECHREHQGIDHPLTRVADQQCAECHADLRRVLPASLETTFAQSIRSLADHPQPAWDVAEPPPTTHGIWSKAQWVEGADGSNGQWEDKAAIRFSHANHLRHTDVFGESPESCAKCHQPTRQGGHFVPIQYETQCASCHPLYLNSQTAADGPLPHADVESVVAVIRRRLLQYIDKHPGELNAQQPATRLPDRGDVSNRSSRAADKWQWVEEKLDQVKVNSLGELHPHSTTRAGCLLCHMTEDNIASDQPLDTWTIIPPSIPASWYSYARFPHDQHKTVDCLLCHRAESSNAQSDILMPSLLECRQCHRDEQESVESLPEFADVVSRGDGPVRRDCVTCHQYHHQTETQNIDSPADSATMKKETTASDIRNEAL